MAAVAVNARVYHDDYGTGTIIMDRGSQVQVRWDRPQPGTPDHHTMLHDRSVVEDMQEAPEE